MQVRDVISWRETCKENIRTMKPTFYILLTSLVREQRAVGTILGGTVTIR